MHEGVSRNRPTVGAVDGARATQAPLPQSPTITVAPTGARRGKADHPRLPISIEEIAACAAECQAAGAARIHLHVRDRDGNHSLDCGRYREAIAAVQAAAPGMAIQVTTEAAGIYGVADQLAVIEGLRPAEASVAIRESIRDAGLARRLYAVADEARIGIQHIVFDEDDIALLRHAMRQGIVPGTMRDVLLVLGRYVPPTDADPARLAPFRAALGTEFDDWSVCAFGASEHAILLRAAEMGGKLRVGFENNIHRPDGTPARDNAENVARIARAVADRAAHTPKEVPA